MAFLQLVKVVVAWIQLTLYYIGVLKVFSLRIPNMKILAPPLAARREEAAEGRRTS
jgi:hypothetical protein